MLPYGKKIRHNYKDNHPQKGYENWWEADMDTANKKKERQHAKKEIKIEKDNTNIGID